VLVGLHVVITGYRVRATFNATTMPSRAPRGETTCLSILMHRIRHARHPACGMKASDPRNKETAAAVTPAQLDPEFGPNASRRSSEELRRAGRTLRAVVRGTGGRADQKGRRPRPSSSGGCRWSSHRSAANESAPPPVGCWRTFAQRGHSTGSQPSLPSGKPQWTPCGRRPRTPLGCWRSPVCLSFRRSSVLCRVICPFLADRECPSSCCTALAPVVLCKIVTQILKLDESLADVDTVLPAPVRLVVPSRGHMSMRCRCVLRCVRRALASCSTPNIPTIPQRWRSCKTWDHRCALLFAASGVFDTVVDSRYM
jgi:hypothetical protein